jgi:hypothetical protein
LANSTIAITSTEEFSTETDLTTINKILIIELRRGGFKLTREEVYQVQGYSTDLISAFKGARINAFVVGDNLADNIQNTKTIKVGDNDEGKVYVTTFSQLVDTAERRLFGLRQKLASMYDDVPGMDLYKQTQLNFK